MVEFHLRSVDITKISSFCLFKEENINVEEYVLIIVNQDMFE